MSANSGKQARAAGCFLCHCHDSMVRQPVACPGAPGDRLAGDPRDYFNPLEVVPRCQEWGLLGPGVYSLPRVPEADFVDALPEGGGEGGDGP